MTVDTREEGPASRTASRVSGLWGWVALLVVLAIAGAGLAAWPRVVAYRRARALAALRETFDLAERDDLRSIERELGFSRLTSREWPQVTAPEGIDTVGIPYWHAAEAHGARAEGLAPDARGIAVEWAPEGGLSIAEPNLDLPDHLRARTWEEATWVAFVSSRLLEGAYHYGNLEVAVERVDVRLVLPDEELVVARGTAEALPPRDTSVPMDEHRLSDATVALLLTRVLEAALAAPEGEPPPPGWDGECVRDRMGEAVSSESEGDCARGATAACLAACRDGNGRSCAEAAYALEHAEDPEAHRLYRLGCAYGDMNACTNYGAWLTAFLPDDADALRCAYEVFVATCATDDHFGCGMQGSLLAKGRGVDADPEAATELLRATCRALGQFPCDTLGYLAATDVLPNVTLEEAQRAFETSCRSGYDSACGRSAAEIREASRAQNEE